MKNQFYLLNTFSRDKFKGNPTPVCVLSKLLSDHQMHNFAIEFNAPVTVFIQPSYADGIYPLRYFTKTGEIPACGHATLGAAFVMFQKTETKHLSFMTIDKITLFAKEEHEMVFIKYPKFQRSEFEISQETLDSLCLKAVKAHFYCKELESLFIELSNEAKVKQIEPDFDRLKNSSEKIKEVVVMSKSENHKYDFVLRSFCPWIGIDEDPVTGSVHSVLGPYWSERLNIKELIVYQNSKRGGYLYVNSLEESVDIGGYCNVIVEGELLE